MKITAAECLLVETDACPCPFDLKKTLENFNVKFVDFESDTESFDNDNDTAVVLISKKTDSWEFFKAVYALKPDLFLFEKVAEGTVKLGLLVRVFAVTQALFEREGKRVQAVGLALAANVGVAHRTLMRPLRSGWRRRSGCRRCCPRHRGHRLLRHTPHRQRCSARLSCC